MANKKSWEEILESTNNYKTFDDLVTEVYGEGYKPRLNTKPMSTADTTVKSGSTTTANTISKKETVEDKTTTPKTAAKKETYDEKKKRLTDEYKSAKRDKWSAALDYVSKLAHGSQEELDTAKKNYSKKKDSQYKAEESLDTLKKKKWEAKQQENVDALESDKELNDLVKQAYEYKKKAEDTAHANAAYTGGNPFLIASSGKSQKHQQEYQSKYDELVNKITAKGYDANDLVETYTNQQNQKQVENVNKQSEENAKERPVTSAVGSVATTPAQGLSAIQGAANFLRSVGNPFNSYDNEYVPTGYMPSLYSGAFAAPTEFKDTVRETQGEDIYNKVAEDTENEKIAKAARFAYQTGMSMGDSALAATMPGVSGAAMLGGSAFSSALRENKDVSADRGFTTAALQGVNEMLGEAVSLGSFKAFKAAGGSGVGTFFKNVGKQMLVEGSEEVETDLLNSIGDKMINGEHSDLDRQYHELKQQGYNDDEAFAEVANNYKNQLLESFAAGALSGGAFGVTGASINQMNQNAAYRNMGAEVQREGGVQGLIDSGLASERQTKSYKAASALQQQLDEDKYNRNSEEADYSILSNKKLGQLRQYNAEAIADESETKQPEVKEQEVEETEAPETLSVNKVKNNKLYVNTQSGVQDVDNVQFDDAETEKIYKTAATYGDSAKAYVTGYTQSNNQTNAADYATGFAQVYKAQKQGYTFEQAYTQAQKVSNISESQAILAYGAAEAESAAPNVMYSKVQRDFGKAVNSKVTPGATIVSQNMTPQQQAEVELLGAFAKNNKREVVVIDSFKDIYNEKFNGAYVNGKVVLALDNSSGMLAPYFGHEMAHDFKQNARAEYDKLQDYVIERLQNNASYDFEAQVQKTIEAYRFEGTDEQKRTKAFEEMTANACFTVLSEKENFEQLVKDDRNLAEKVRDYFTKFVNEIRKALEKLTNTAEYRALHDDVEAKEQILKMWNECLKASNKAESKSAKNAKDISKTAKNESKSQKSTPQHSKDVDTAYMQAAENGDEETAQKYVDEAAMEWGAYSADGKTPLKLYHGTQAFGFTEFDLNYMDDRRSIFVTSDINTAQTYSGTKAKRNIDRYFKDFSLEEAIDYYREKYKDRADVRRIERPEMEQMAADAKTALEDYRDALIALSKKDLLDRTNFSIQNNIYNINTALNTWDDYNPALKDITTVFLNSEISEALMLYYPDTAYANQFKWQDVVTRYANVLPALANNEDAFSVEIKGKQSKYSAYNPFVFYYTEKTANERIKQEMGGRRGNYSLYTKLLNPLVVDAKYSNWNSVSPKEVYRQNPELTDKIYTIEQSRYNGKDVYEIYSRKGRKVMVDNQTAWDSYNEARNALYDLTEEMTDALGNMTLRKISEIASRDYYDYDGVVIKNVIDDGGRGEYRSGVADYIVIAFKPSQVKSADPVTYDNNGEVIPLNERFTESKDIRFSKDVDSEGNKLTDKQQEYFKDSKVRDENGRLRVVYHGTDSNFYTFDISKSGKHGSAYGYGFYFTPNETKAHGFGNRIIKAYLNLKRIAAFDNKTVKTQEIEKLISKMVDFEIKQYEDEEMVWQDSFMSNYVYTYGMNKNDAIREVAEIVVNGNSNDANVILELATASGMNYDAVSAQEFYNLVTDTTGFDGIQFEDEIIAFAANQIKLTDNKTPTKNADIRFSLDVPVEETKDLIAVHNLSETKLLKALRLGGMPMPSIAISRAQYGHGEFGDISLVFPKSTINPATGRNLVWSGDAYTPTYPQVDYKIRKSARDEAEDKVAGLLAERGYNLNTFDYLQFDSDTIADKVKYDDLIRYYKGKTGIMAAYLIDKGVEFEPVMADRMLSGFGRVKNNLVIKVANRLGEDRVIDAYENSNYDGIENVIADVFEEDVQSKLTDEDKKKYANEPFYTPDDVIGMRFEVIDAAYKYFKYGIEQAINTSETDKLLSNLITDDTDYEKWVKDLFTDIVEKEGIRNNRDIYTSSGYRRSFEALHYEHTLENAVRAMKEKGTQGIGAFGSNIFGASKVEYGSIEDIRANKEKLIDASSSEVKEAYEEKRTELSNRLYELAKAIPNYSDFSSTDAAAEILIEAVLRYSTKTGMDNYIRRELEGWGTYSPSIVDDLMAIVDDIRALPAAYFEAKPQRAVYFNEVYTAVIPDNSSAELKTALDDAGVEYKTYKAGDEQARTDVLNSLEEVKFSKDIDAPPESIVDQDEDVFEMNETLRQMIRLVSYENNALRERFGIRDVRTAKDSAVSKLAAEFRKKYGSSYNKSQLVSQLADLYNYITNAGVDINSDYIWNTAKDIATNILDKTQYKDTTVYDDYKELRKYIKGTKIFVPDDVRADMTDYNDFRKRNYGKLNLANSGIELDSFYTELAKEYPVFFPADAVKSEQLEALANFFIDTNPIYYSGAEQYAENEGLSMDEYTNIVAADIFDQYFNVPEVKSFVSDKFADEMAALQTDFEQQIADLRESYKNEYESQLEQIQSDNLKRLEQLKQENSKALEKMNEKNLEQLAKQKAHFKEVGKNATERRHASQVRRKIDNLRKQITRKLLNPSDTSYVPTYLVKEMAGVCDTIINAQRQWKNGNLKPEKTILRLDALHRQYQALANDGDYDYSSEYDPEMAAKINALANKMNGKQVSEMSLAQLEDVYNVLRDIKNALVDATQQIGREEKISNHQVGVKIIKELQATKGKRNTVIGMYEMDTLNPIRAIRKITEYNDDAELYKLTLDLNEGQRKADKFIADASKPFDALISNSKAYNKFRDEMIETELKDKDGNPVSMTAEQIAQLVMTARRNQGLTHIEKGGFELSDIKQLRKGKKADAKISGVKVDSGYSYDSINGLYSLLDDYAKKWITAAEHLFNVVGKNAINETSLILKHRKIANVDYYIPLVVDTNFTGQEIEGLKVDKTIEGMGSLKSTVPNAGQPIVINGLTSVIEKHIDDVAKYSGLAIPIRNFNKAYKVQTSRFYDDMPQTSVKSTLQDKWGTFGTDMADSILSDLQSSRAPRNTSYEFVGKALDKVQQGFVQATLAANISVTIKQAASYPTAGAVLSANALSHGLKAFAYTGAKQTALYNEIDEHTGTHYKRRQGMSTQELGDLAKSNALINKIPAGINPMKWIQFMDVQTTAALWEACKYEVKHQGVTVGTEEYWQKVTDLYDYTVETTQPNYDILHRPEVQKTTNRLVKSIVMFKTQPLQNTGIIYDSLFNLQAKEKQFKEKKITKEELNEAKKTFAKSVSSQVAAAVTFASMSLLAAAIKHTMSGYRDDDDDVTVQSIIQGYLSSLGQLFATVLLPIGGGEAYDFVKRLTSDSKFNYDIVSVPIVSTINDYIDAVTDFKNAATDLATDEGDAKDTAEAFTKILTQSATALGIPVNNAISYSKGVWKNIEDIVNGEFGTFEKDKKANNEYDNLYNVLTDKGYNSAEYNTARQELIAEKEKAGVKGADKRVDNAIKKRALKRYKALREKKGAYKRAEEARQLCLSLYGGSMTKVEAELKKLDE